MKMRKSVTGPRLVYPFGVNNRLFSFTTKVFGEFPKEAFKILPVMAFALVSVDFPC